jgi:hypothetical protein
MIDPLTVSMFDDGKYGVTDLLAAAQVLYSNRQAPGNSLCLVSGNLENLENLGASIGLKRRVHERKWVVSLEPYSSS